jgi:hypothetical protein
MAQLPLNQYKTITGIVSTSNVGIYTTKTGYTTVVLYAQVANTGTGIGTVTFYHERDTRLSGGGISTETTEILYKGVVPPNDALILLDGRLILERTALKTDRIRMVGVSTTSPNHLKYTVSILETLNQ